MFGIYTLKIMVVSVNSEPHKSEFNALLNLTIKYTRKEIAKEN